ncbi:MAG: Wzz/FepE/Etk N-terminal domain-containing protein [Nitrospirota bacterium]
MEDEINLLDYWNVLWRRKKMLIALCITAVVMALVIGKLSSRFYKSDTVVIATGSDAGGLGAALSALPLAGAFAGAAGIQGPADKVMVILKSRTTAEAVIQRFNLMRVFYEDQWDPLKGAWKKPDKPPLMEDTVKLLTNGVAKFTKSKEGAITISVEWKDPKLAADMANFYVTALTSFLNEKAINVTIQVVDRAVPAERRSRPKIKLNMALAGVTSLFAGVFLAFFLEYLEKSRAAQPKD